MSRRKINSSKKKVFVSLLIISVVLLLTPRRYTRVLNDTFTKFTNSLLSKGPKSSQGVLAMDSEKQKTVSDAQYQELKEEYIALKADHANAIADLRIAKEQISKLAQVNSTLPKPGPGLVFANVTNAYLTGTKKELMIDKGSASHIRKGQYVLAKNNIIGTVHDVTDSTAKIRFVTDSRHNIQIMILRDDDSQPIRGQLFGMGNASCSIPLIPQKNDIRFGDMVYADVKPGFLYTPRVIGSVSMAQPSEKEPLLWDITVRPIYPAQQITEVAIIVMNPDNINGK